MNQILQLSKGDDMAPKRKDPTLPPRVTRKHGAYYYLAPTEKDGQQGTKWLHLGNTETDMYRSLAELKKERAGLMKMVIQRYRTEVMPKKSRNTQNTQGPQLDRLEAIFGHMKPRQIKPHHIAKMHDLESDTPFQANRELALIGHVMKYAVRWGYRDDNPAREIQRYPEPPRNRYVTHDEYKAVRETAPLWVQLLMDLAYLTGQRRVDLLKIKRADMTTEGLLITQSKTGTRLLIEWSADLRNACQSCLDTQHTSSIWLLCDNHGQPRKDAAFTTAWTRLMNKCIENGILEEKFQFRDLRAKAGSDSSGEQLGHRSKAILEKHYRRLPKHVKPTQ